MNKLVKADSIKPETVKVTLVKSLIGTIESHRACVRGLGLRRIGSSSVVENTPSVRGMINQVSFLVKCEGC